mgnify:CR=1 FL=1
MKILIATKNNHKVRELNQMLNLPNDNITIQDFINTHILTHNFMLVNRFCKNRL